MGCSYEIAFTCDINMADDIINKDNLKSHLVVHYATENRSIVHEWWRETCATYDKKS